METRVLHYFLKIAQTGTISQAARELHVTQPTLSRQLRALEAELGTPLFIRKQHAMVLTPAGSQYQSSARQILAMVDRAKQGVQQSNDDLVGTIAIGCIEANAAKLMAAAITQFHHQHPAVKFELYDLDSTDINERLDQGLIDLGLVLKPNETEKYHRYNLNLEDRWGVVVARASQFAQQTDVRLAMLKKLPLLVTRNTLVQSELSEILGLPVDHLNIVGTQNLVTTSLYLAQQGVAFPLCAGGAFIQDTADLKFIPLHGARPIKQQLIWSKQRATTDAVTEFIRVFEAIDQHD